VKLSWILPVHNNADTITANVVRLEAQTRQFEQSEIVLVENGSRDASWTVCEGLQTEGNEVDIRAYREASAGIGFAYARGLAELEAQHGPDPMRWAILTGSDLPFGFTDLDAALPLMEAGRVAVIAGSKAHRESQAYAGWKRHIMSRTFRILRRVIVGMVTGDSQGSFFVRLDVAIELAHKIASRDFFYTTELVHYAERLEGGVVEVPVIVEPSQLVGITTVKPLKHGSAMLKQLVALRRRS
jgi:glycosyltransferase involved in cell wall biosynthesis